jgi:hypothetical protein
VALSKEEREQLQKLMDKEKEPAGPPAGTTFHIDLGSDSAWERAKKLGLISEPVENGDGEEGEGEGEPGPKGRSGYFGGQ